MLLVHINGRYERWRLCYTLVGIACNGKLSFAICSCNRDFLMFCSWCEWTINVLIAILRISYRYSLQRRATESHRTLIKSISTALAHIKCYYLETRNHWDLLHVTLFRIANKQKLRSLHTFLNCFSTASGTRPSINNNKCGVQNIAFFPLLKKLEIRNNREFKYSYERRKYSCKSRILFLRNTTCA